MNIIITVLVLGAVGVWAYAQGREDEAKRSANIKSAGYLCVDPNCPKRVQTFRELARTVK